MEPRKFLRVAKLCFLALILLTNNIDADAKASRSRYERLIRSQGPNLYTLAWPSATYKSVEIQTVQLTESGAEAVVVLRGRSTFDNSELWVQTLLKFRDGKFVDLHWSTHSPSLFSPGSTVNDLQGSLAKINEGRGPKDFIWGHGMRLRPPASESNKPSSGCSTPKWPSAYKLIKPR